MAIPSGSGTEVLKVSTATITTNSATNLITGVANHIYTVLSINICETANATEAMDLYVKFRGRKPIIEPLLKVRGLKE